MPVVTECQAIRTDRALTHGVEVAERLLVFGARGVAGLALDPAAGPVAGRAARLRNVQQVEVLRQQLCGLLEGGAVVRALVELAEAVGAEGVAAQQHSGASKRLVRVIFVANWACKQRIRGLMAFCSC